MICHSCHRQFPDEFIVFDFHGNVMPGMGLGGYCADVKDKNILKYLDSNWDKKVLKEAMTQAKMIKPELLPLTFRFVDKIKHFNCQLFRLDRHFLIGGCGVRYGTIPFPIG